MLYPIKAAFAALIILKNVSTARFIAQSSPAYPVQISNYCAKGLIGLPLWQILLLLSKLSLLEIMQSITKLNNLIRIGSHLRQEILCNLHSL